MENINKLRRLYHLKNVERTTSVKTRKESSAEHSWSCLILADYFLNTMQDSSLDRIKVYELLMYHDVVEIESGDTCISKVEERKNKEEKERLAAEKLKNEFPEVLKNKFIKLFNEFEEQKTKEARFAKAIDQLDAEIQVLDYKEDWKGWTEEFLRSKKLPLFEEFPEILTMFESFLKYAKEHGYFNQT